MGEKKKPELDEEESSAGMLGAVGVRSNVGEGCVFFLCPTVCISTVDSAETGPSEGVPMGGKARR